jgi:hypothetical protein
LTCHALCAIVQPLLFDKLDFTKLESYLEKHLAGVYLPNVLVR